jgi:imidazolonepropionase-like amidohydrolase
MDTAAARRPGPAVALVTLLLTLGAVMAAQRAAVPPAPGPLLLTGARVLDVREGRYLPAAGVLIGGDRVDAILAAIPASLPAGTRRIDLAGATLVPGLGDMFATASPDGSADADFYYAMALAHGVTSYRVVGARLPWAASERGRVAAGEIVAPRLWIGGPGLEQEGAMSFATRRVADAAAAAREVAAQASLGAQWVSVAGGTSPEVC